MDEHRFDQLTKRLASGTSRRRVLQGLGGTLAGLVLAGGGRQVDAAKGGTGHNGGNGHHGGGTPQGRCPAGYTNCRGECVILSADLNNCGACAVVCPAGWGCCAGTCQDLGSDLSNCGSCGHACPVPANGSATCTNGECGFTCDAGYTDCGNDVCADLASDPNNCGGCGRICGSGHVCIHGGCFQVISDCATECFNRGCKDCGILAESPNHVCDTIIGTSCSSDADCPFGQACSACLCVAPC